MVNRYRGEVAAVIDGEQRTLVLTLGALAELEDWLGVEDLAALAKRLTSGRLSAREATAVIAAGLRGAGADITHDDVGRMRIDGGAAGVARLVAELLSATFSPVEPGQRS